jgi:hypothetical protein
VDQGVRAPDELSVPIPDDLSRQLPFSATHLPNDMVARHERHAAARQIAGMTLSVRVLEVDEPTAKAAILGLNRGQRATRELEEAWIVQGLVRDDGSGDPSYVNGAPTSG